MTRTGLAALARRVGAGAALVLVVAALDFVFRDLSLAALRSALLHQSPMRVAACLALTSASFACLALYDVVGVHIAARHRVRRGR